MLPLPLSPSRTGPVAARRLIIIMVILLGISTLLAAALPDRVRDAEEEQTGERDVGQGDRDRGDRNGRTGRSAADLRAR